MMAAIMAGACTTTEQTFVTSEFEDNHLSGQIRIPVFKTDYQPAFLGYQTYTDTILQVNRTTCYSPHSILYPDTTYTVADKEVLMEFGNDNLRAVIRYHSDETCMTYTGHGFVMNLLAKDRSEDTYNILIARLQGIISSPAWNDTAVFTFFEGEGCLVAGKDSFLLQVQYDKPGKLMRTRIGVQLMKEDMIYGVLNTFTGVFPHKVYIYAKAGTRDQFLVAAYLAVVAWYVFNW